MTSRPQDDQTLRLARSDRKSRDVGLPRVTVNVLAYNRRNDLQTTLTTIFEGLDYPASRLDVVVVDNASTDGTAELVLEKFPKARLLTLERNTGISGWNAGFRTGRGDYFLVLDDDCYLSGDSLRSLVGAAKDESADLVSFPVSSPWEEGFTFDQAYATGLLSFWGCSVLISRRAIERVGGFDPNIFIWAHEVEFTARVLNAGLRHLFLPDVTSVHLKREPRARPPTRAFVLHIRNLAYFAGKSLRARDATGALLNLAIKCAMYSLTRPSRARALPALGAGALLGIRRRSSLRPPVSRLYRKNFPDFVNPLRTTRGIGARVGIKRDRTPVFFRARGHLYPRRRASLDL